uniref:Cyclin-dependent kinase inhibitor domain-containing protein n=1 Tax=Plectus sambesii TaxID=2011161 RepID=A0A914XFJ9_9BILA
MKFWSCSDKEALISTSRLDWSQSVAANRRRRKAGSVGGWPCAPASAVVSSPCRLAHRCYAYNATSYRHFHFLAVLAKLLDRRACSICVRPCMLASAAAAAMSKPRCCRRLVFDTDEERSTDSNRDSAGQRIAPSQQRLQPFIEQLREDAARAKERWGFDFDKEIPASTSSPYVWECVPAGKLPGFYSRVGLKRSLGVPVKKTASLPSSLQTFIDAPMLRSVSAPARASSTDSEELNDSDDGGYGTNDGAVTPTAVMFASIAADVDRLGGKLSFFRSKCSPGSVTPRRPLPSTDDCGLAGFRRRRSLRAIAVRLAVAVAGASETPVTDATPTAVQWATDAVAVCDCKKGKVVAAIAYCRQRVACVYNGAGRSPFRPRPQLESRIDGATIGLDCAVGVHRPVLGAIKVGASILLCRSNCAYLVPTLVPISSQGMRGWGSEADSGHS